MTVAKMHRLGCSLAQVNNGKPAVAELRGSIGVLPKSFPVRPRWVSASVIFLNDEYCIDWKAG